MTTMLADIRQRSFSISMSKAALAMFSSAMRLELQPFGIKVVGMKTGTVRSNLIRNNPEMIRPSLPQKSIYEPAKEVVEKNLRREEATDAGMPSQQGAKLVVQDLKKKPRPVIWGGERACIVRIGSLLPSQIIDGMLKKATGIQIVEQIVRKKICDFYMEDWFAKSSISNAEMAPQSPSHRLLLASSH